MSAFTEAFWATFQGVLQIILVALAAGILVRKKVITQEQIKAISAVTVNVLLPCLAFSSIMKNFYPGQLRIWPVLPIAAAGTILIGLSVGTLVFFRELPQKRNMLPLASMQNAAYLVIPLGAVLYAHDFERFKLYCFLYVPVISVVVWSIGKYLISSEKNGKPNFGDLVTPPFVANIIAIIFVFTHIRNFVPQLAINAIDLVGSATVPVAIFILGAVLGSISFKLKPYLFDAFRVILVKLIIVPFLIVVFLYLTGLKASYPLLASFLVLQSCSAPATAIIIQIQHYGGDEQKISSIVMFSYLVSIITIPFWVALWNAMAA